MSIEKTALSLELQKLNWISDTGPAATQNILRRILICKSSEFQRDAATLAGTLRTPENILRQLKRTKVQ